MNKFCFFNSSLVALVDDGDIDTCTLTTNLMKFTKKQKIVVCACVRAETRRDSFTMIITMIKSYINVSVR